jgi:hypothetical protein
MTVVDKNVGFNRNIRLAWLDAAAAFCTESDDPAEIRARLDSVVGQEIASTENRRKAIDILANIWVKTADAAPVLREQALRIFEASPVTSDRIWLHYGLAIVSYPFFREVAEVIGKLAWHGSDISPAVVKQRLIAEFGQLGSLDKAVERVIFSLRDWGILTATGRRNVYAPRCAEFHASTKDLETWLLACAVRSNPAQEVLFADLVRLPELFPFRLTVTEDHLRHRLDLTVQRQGPRWDMVGYAA